MLVLLQWLIMALLKTHTRCCIVFFKENMARSQRAIASQAIVQLQLYWVVDCTDIVIGLLTCGGSAISFLLSKRHVLIEYIVGQVLAS